VTAPAGKHVAGRSLEDKCVQVARCLVAHCKFEPSESARDALDLCGTPILLDNYISPHGHPGLIWEVIVERWRIAAVSNSRGGAALHELCAATRLQPCVGGAAASWPSTLRTHIPKRHKR